MDTLKVGSSYNFYSKYSTIIGQKVQVVGILTYNECKKYAFDMITYAINERVISVKDEDLESEIGNDNIYLLRALNASADNTYNEFIVWDSTVNYDKTIALDEEYTSTLTIKVDKSIDYGISQIIDTIKNAINSNYGSSVEISISTPTTNITSDNTNKMATYLTEDTLSKAESIIDSLNNLQNKLIPAAQQIINSNISENISTIGNNISTIKNEISLIKRGL